MGTYVGTVLVDRTKWVALVATLVVVVSLALAGGIALGVTSIASSTGPQEATRDVDAGYGASYPAHGGLAGPSGFRAEATHPGYGAAYPQHGGLAGPSDVRAEATHPGVGDGYPQHGGLAGPSGVGGNR